MDDGGWECWRFRSGADGSKAANDCLEPLSDEGKNSRPLAGGDGEEEPVEEDDSPPTGESTDDSEAVEEKPERLPRRKGWEEEEVEVEEEEEEGYCIDECEEERKSLDWGGGAAK